MQRARVALAAVLVALLAAPASAAAQSGPQLGPGALNRYVGPESYHLVTPVPVGSPYRYESTLGYLLPAGGPGRRAIHGCTVDGRDHFLSLDPGCEGQRSLGRHGFAYDAPPPDVATVAVFRCYVPGKDHFASPDPDCEGQRTEALLGHLRARGDALLRYAGGPHRVTAGPVPEGLTYEANLGFLRPAPGDGLHAIHGCAAGADHFLSLDPGCEGQARLGVEGYAYDAPSVNEETIAVYRCYVPGSDHFASHDPGCEGQRTEGRLGYLRVNGDALAHYENHGTGTSWVTPGGVGRGYRYVRTLGFLLPIGGPNLVAIHGCRAGANDQFLSTDPGCEGSAVLGRYGFAYASPPPGEATVTLYRCLGGGRGHFASLDPNCDGAVTERALGDIRTSDGGPAPPPACGPSQGAISLAFAGPRPGAARTVRFGRSATLSGRATAPDGSPAAGAQISIAADAGGLTEVGRVLTGGDGSFAFALPAGPSRTFRAAFRASPADPAYACSGAVRLRVRAGVTLKVSKRKVRNGQRVYFRGRVQGEPLPPTRKLVLLQALDRGRWRTFATPRSLSGGRYRASYRFKRTRRTTTYRFRARVPVEGGFPYLRGTSRQVRVRVAPRRGG